ncbi:MAG: Methylcobamide:CoM methyltransferase MtbA [Candidatus Thorarchaeota archaeon AB_25]|nr:MAG: Methylcobamide:CoM methyltransferase MtbA [Candidatus Thorarchaeota archaeon AB_25]
MLEKNPSNFMCFISQLPVIASRFLAMSKTSYDTVVEAVQFKETNWIPVIPIVGLYSMNISGLSPNEILHDSEKQAKSQLACQSRFNYDGIFNVMDLSVEAQTLGAEVEFPTNSFPYLKSHPLDHPERFDKIPSLEVKSTRLSVFTDTINRIAEKTKRELYISSYVIGPFTLAGHLLGIDDLMELTVEDEETTASLVAHCAKVVEPYIEAQVEAGTDNIVILEPSASSSLISPRFFEMFSFQNVKSLVSRIHNLGVGATLHICGKTSRILEMMCETGADVLSIDSPVTISKAMKLIEKRACLMGNVDTTLMIEGTSEEVALAADACIEVAGNSGGFILSTSCDMPIEVPEVNLLSLVESSLHRRS